METPNRFPPAYLDLEDPELCIEEYLFVAPALVVIRTEEPLLSPKLVSPKSWPPRGIV